MNTKRVLYCCALSVLIISLLANGLIIVRNVREYNSLLEENRARLSVHSAKDALSEEYRSLWNSYREGKISSDSLRAIMYKDYPGPLVCPYCKSDVAIAYITNTEDPSEIPDILDNRLNFDKEGRERRHITVRARDGVEWVCTSCYEDFYEDGLSIVNAR